jgi:hypothetical protein
MAPYSSNLMCSAPIQCIWLQYIDIHLPYDNPKLPYGAYGSSLMPDDSHMVHRAHRDSTWCHMALTWLRCVPNMGNMAPEWLTLGSRCTTGSHTALIQCMQLPYGACGTYVAYAAPIWCTQLPYSTHGSHIEHTTLMWPSHGTCSLHMVPCVSHMVPSSSKMAHTAPTHHTQLPYGPHMSHSAPR